MAYSGFDGTVIAGGWINKHYVQLGYQLADSMAILSYSFVVTLIILVHIFKDVMRFNFPLRTLVTGGYGPNSGSFTSRV